MRTAWEAAQGDYVQQHDSLSLLLGRAEREMLQQKNAIQKKNSGTFASESRLCFSLVRSVRLSVRPLET